MDTALTHEERRQLLEVLQQLDPSAPHERRRDLRRKALVNLWIRKISKGRSQAPLQLVLVNVSPGGAGFLGKASLAVEVGKEILENGLFHRLEIYSSLA